PSVQLSYVTRDLFTYIFNYTFPFAYALQPFDVLISAGWLDFATQAGFVLSKLSHRKFVVWSESTAYEPNWRRTVARPLVTAMVKHADACICVGTRSREYLRELGARDRDIFTAFSTVDVAYFQHVSQAGRIDRDERKLALGVRRRRVMLFCGQFI